jgi:TonB family protein
MSHYLESSGLSRHSAALGGIIGLHILVIYLFATGLVIKVLPNRVEPLVATVTDAPRPPLEATPLPGPRLDTFAIQIPSVPTPVQTAPEDPPRDTILAPDRPSAFADPGPLIRDPLPIRLIGQNRFPDSEDYYPSDLRRMGIEGAAIVQACVDEQGALRGNPVIERSSGNPRLDAGALNVARAGRYARSIQGTTQVPNCFHIRIGFRMKK